MQSKDKIGFCQQTNLFMCMSACVYALRKLEAHIKNLD